MNIGNFNYTFDLYTQSEVINADGSFDETFTYDETVFGKLVKEYGKEKTTAEGNQYYQRTIVIHIYDRSIGIKDRIKYNGD